MQLRSSAACAVYETRRLHAEAEQQLVLRKRWWRENRDKAPDLLERELAAAIDHLAKRAEAFPVWASGAGESSAVACSRRPGHTSTS
jgi:hypothetical protein